MLFGSGKDEDSMCWRFFQCLEEGVECRCREHVNLVDDKHLVFPDLRRYAHLFYKLTDVID